MNRNITLFAYANAIAAILASLATPFARNFTSHWIITFFHGYWLDILNLQQWFFGFNFLNVVANLLLLLGARQFAKSDGRRNRLLSYSLALLMINNAAAIIEVALFSEYWLSAILNILKSGALTFLSWIFLKHIANTKEPNTASSTDEGQRALHWLVDTATILVAITPFDFAARLVDSSLSWYFFVAVLRIAYYIIFEIAFRATPGKMATGTEVVSDDNLPANPTQIVLRTFSRFIPLDALSFFVTRGWHDTLSKTKVVMSKQTE